MSNNNKGVFTAINSNTTLSNGISAISLDGITPSSQQPVSYWDTLPYEIKKQILDECDLLTKHRNNILTESQTKTHATAIWNLAIKLNFQQNLSTLPVHGFPNVNNGLALVSSKDFYHRL
ncbi:hypothetical protein HDU76_010889, partial [Blyttiomyces sp. JEL0837]